MLKIKTPNPQLGRLHVFQVEVVREPTFVGVRLVSPMRVMTTILAQSTPSRSAAAQSLTTCRLLSARLDSASRYEHRDGDL
jgi:hypothetical protein